MKASVFRVTEPGDWNLCPVYDSLCVQSAEPGESNLCLRDTGTILCVQFVEPGESNLCPGDDGPQEEVR
jgi:hypothetical protein